MLNLIKLANVSLFPFLILVIDSKSDPFFGTDTYISLNESNLALRKGPNMDFYTFTYKDVNCYTLYHTREEGGIYSSSIGV